MKKQIKLFFQNIVRHTKEAGKSFKRNFGLALSSIAAITITLLVTSVSLLAIINVNHFADLVKKEVTIYVEVNKEVNEENVKPIIENIKKLENVDLVDYSSKDQELDLLIDAYPEHTNIFEMYRGEENPLHNVLFVTVKDVNTISKTAKQITEMENIYSVRYGEGLVESLLEIFEIVKNGSFIIIIALFLVTSFLIGNTIKITIFSRRKEIEIMRLVGASNIFIKTPFVFEGLIIGIIGALIPIGLTIYGYFQAFELFNASTIKSPFLQLVEPLPVVTYISAILLTLGIIIGMWGSGRAVRKFLKV